MRLLALTLTLALLGLGGCASTSPNRLTAAGEAVEIGTETPDSGSEQLARIAGHGFGQCKRTKSNRAWRSARAALRNSAAEHGADYVRLLGVGPLEDRGICTDDVARFSGIAYGKNAADGLQDTASEGGPEKADTDSPKATDEGTSAAAAGQRDTASKLRELERLHGEGLISDSEYQRRREQILDAAF